MNSKSNNKILMSKFNFILLLEKNKKITPAWLGSYSFCFYNPLTV